MWHFREQLWCLAHSPLIVGMTKLYYLYWGRVLSQYNVFGKLNMQKKPLNLSAEAIINVPNARLCARCALFVLKMKQIPFPWRFFKGVYSFEENPKSIQDVIGDMYCPGKHWSNRENCESLGGYVTMPRSIFGCGKCGAWLFVHKVPLRYKST